MVISLSKLHEQWKHIIYIQYDASQHRMLLLSCQIICGPKSLQPFGLWPTRLLHPWDLPGKNTGVDCPFFLQGIFLTKGSNPHYCIGKFILYPWATKEALSFLFKDGFIEAQKRCNFDDVQFVHFFLGFIMLLVLYLKKASPNLSHKYIYLLYLVQLVIGQAIDFSNEKCRLLSMSMPKKMNLTV